MRVRIHIEDLEIDLGGEREPHPLAQAFGVAVAPFVSDWLSRHGGEIFGFTRRSKPPEPEQPSAPPPQTVDGAPEASPAEPVANGVAAAEV